MQLYTKILLGLVLGAVIGFVANVFELQGLTTVLLALEPIGTAFIRLITMIIIPLVVASLMVGTASLGDLAKLGRIGGKTIGFYLCTTAVAVTIGLVVSNVVQPGSRIDDSTRDALSARFEGDAVSRMQLADEAPRVIDTLLNIIPRNPIESAANLELLPLIFFTIIFAAAVSVIAPKRR
ncbi:hypothetical protein BH23GEM11_BH23GEM11_05640 [soil metagenome]